MNVDWIGNAWMCGELIDGWDRWTVGWMKMDKWMSNCTCVLKCNFLCHCHIIIRFSRCGRAYSSARWLHLLLWSQCRKSFFPECVRPVLEGLALEPAVRRAAILCFGLPATCAIGALGTGIPRHAGSWSWLKSDKMNQWIWNCYKWWVLAQRSMRPANDVTCCNKCVNGALLARWPIATCISKVCVR